MENIMLPSSAKILDIIHETTAEYTFRVAYDQPIRHGQFFQLSIPKVGEAPISVSAKGDGWIEFTIRKVGRLTEGLFGLQPGHTIFLRGPYGNYFPLESFDNKALVLIAGGTAMAPVRRLLRHYADNRADIRDVYLIRDSKISTACFSLQGSPAVPGNLQYHCHVGSYDRSGFFHRTGHRTHSIHSLCRAWRL